MKIIKGLALSLTLAFLFILPCQAGDRGNTTNDSFNKAKKILLRDVYRDHRSTFYCGCPFNDQKQILPCEYHAFGQSFNEWRDGHPECVSKNGKIFKGRNCARKISREFRYMESDMYNLVPAIGEINSLWFTRQFGHSWGPDVIIQSFGYFQCHRF